MPGFESVRDWQVYNCLKDFDENSYDFVGRGVELSNSVTAPFLSYLHRNYLVDVVFYSSEDSYDCVMGDLSDVRDLLDDEGFVPRLSISSVENADPGGEVELGGKCYVDPSSEIDEVEASMNSILSSDFEDLGIVHRKN